MKLAAILINVFILSISMSCDSSDDSIQSDFIGEVLFDFSLRTMDGVDLLDPSIEGSYNTSEILYYEKVDGDYVLFNDAMSANPKGFTIDQRDGFNYFNPFYKDIDALSHELKIDWGNGITDFIFVEIQAAENSYNVINKISYNGDVVWDKSNSSEGYYFTILVE